jgi:hypothetical protein
MSEPAPDFDDDFPGDAEMTVEDWLEVVGDAVEEALDDLTENEAGLMRLADFLRRKATEISAMADECEP